MADYVVRNPKLLNIFKFSFDDTVWTDEIFTTITDEQLEEVIEFVAGKDITTVTAEDSLYVYMKARREIYWKLATSKAPLYLINVDGTKVEKNQRFEHYMQLVTHIDVDIKHYEESGQATSVEVGDTYLTSRHHTERNYANTPIPEVDISLDNIYETKVEFRWSAKKVTKFYNYIIYISNNNIIDNYMNKGLGNMNVAAEDATLVERIIDVRQTTYRIEDLEPNTTYHLAVLCFNANTVFGYSEVEFTTKAIPTEDPTPTDPTTTDPTMEVTS